MENVNPAEAYAQIFRAFCNGNDVPYCAWEQFIDESELVRIKQDEFIVTPDQLPTHALFIVKGLVVAYRECAGEKFVHWVRSTDDYVFSWEPARIRLEEDSRDHRETLIAVEDTVAIRIRNEDLLAVCQEYHQFYRRIKAYLTHYKMVFRELDANVHNAHEDRYRNMQGVVNFNLDRVPEEYLASYLSMTVKQLKRMNKKRLDAEKQER